MTSSTPKATSARRHYLVLQAHNPIYSSFPADAKIPSLWSTAKDLNSNMEMVKCMDGSYWVVQNDDATNAEQRIQQQHVYDTGATHHDTAHILSSNGAASQSTGTPLSPTGGTPTSPQVTPHLVHSNYSVQCKHYEPNIFIASFVGVREPVELPEDERPTTDAPTDESESDDSADDDDFAFLTQAHANSSTNTQLPFPHTHYDSHQAATIQMDLIFRLLSMRTDFVKRSVYRGFSMSPHERACIDYIIAEEWGSQASRLGCWEAVDLSNENAARTRDHITRLLGVAGRCKSIIHSLLICQKKMVTMWSCADIHILQPMDVLLLTIESEVRRRQWNREHKKWRRAQRKARQSEETGMNDDTVTRQTQQEPDLADEDEVDEAAPEEDDNEIPEHPFVPMEENEAQESEPHNSPNDSQISDSTTTEAQTTPHNTTTTSSPNHQHQQTPLFETFEDLRLKGNSGDYIQPLRVYFARVNSSMTLVFIGIREDNAKEEEKKMEYRSLKNAIAHRLTRSYADFITITATHHLMTERYLHICPGLIHFIFKDCVRKRILAPAIISLQRDPRAKSSSNNIEIDEKFIRHHVWKMLQTVDQYRELGQYTEMNICTRSAQYCFTEWFVDKNGATIAATDANLKDATEHYELYTIYLPYVSLQAIQTYNKELAKRLSS